MVARDSRKRGGAVLVLATALLAFSVARAEELDVEKADQWEKAAVNWDWAASLHEQQAEEMHQVADALLQKAYEDRAQRRANLIQAGRSQQRAADLHAASVSALNKSAENWRKVAAQYGWERAEDKRRSALAMAELADSLALQASIKTAEAYEEAARTFSGPDVSATALAASATQKAASWRERIAKTL